MEVGTYEVVLNLIYFIALTSLFRNSLNRSKIFILTILKTFVPYCQHISVPQSKEKYQFASAQISGNAA